MLRQLFVVFLISAIALCAPAEEKPRVPSPHPPERQQQQQSIAKRDTTTIQSSSARPDNIQHSPEHARPARDNRSENNNDSPPYQPPSGPPPSSTPNRQTRDTENKDKHDEHPGTVTKSGGPLVKPSATSSEEKSDKH